MDLDQPLLRACVARLLHHEILLANEEVTATESLILLPVGERSVDHDPARYLHDQVRGETDGVPVTKREVLLQLLANAHVHRVVVQRGSEMDGADVVQLDA